MKMRMVGRALLVAFILALLVAMPIAMAQGSSQAWQLLFGPIAVVYLLVGQLIVERRPGNLVGPIVFLLGAAIAAFLIADAYVRQPGPPPGALGVAWAVNYMDAPFFVLIGAMFLVFPDGRLPSPRWRPLVVAMLVAAPIAGLAPAFEPGRLPYYPQFENPFGIEGFPGRAIWAPAYVFLVLCVAASAASLIVRWRRGGPVERAQLKWVAVAAILIGISMTAYAVAFGPGVYNSVMDLLVGLAFGYLPVAIGIAILRYRLYEIDRIISRGLAWTIVSVLLVAVFAGSILVLQGVLAPFTDGSTLAVAASTLLAAALFQPLRARVQRAVDRRFNRSRVDAQRAIDAFGAQLRDEVDLRALQRRLVGAVDTTVKPTRTTLWIRSAAEPER
jgi:hypothetical protein